VLFENPKLDADLVYSNVGVWVGPQMFQSLDDNILSQYNATSMVARQGVDPQMYPGDFEGYLVEGGSNQGAQSLAATVSAYAKACPNSAIVITGWRYVSDLVFFTMVANQYAKAKEPWLYTRGLLNSTTRPYQRWRE
jgi:hypothetical protein